jgi:hypothetical protein
MIKKLLNWFGKKKEPVVPDSVESDPMFKEAILRCWNTGNMVIGNRDKDGKVTITEHKIDRNKS